VREFCNGNLSPRRREIFYFDVDFEHEEGANFFALMQPQFQEKENLIGKLPTFLFY